MTLENLTEYIEGLLRSKPHLRDDDRRLVANVWHYEMKHDNSISDFLTAYVMDKITSADKYVFSLQEYIQSKVKSGYIIKQSQTKQTIAA